MSKPTEDEAREVSRRIPDEPSDVTFEVERYVVREGAGPARVVLPGMVKFFHAEDVETQRRTIRIVNGPWETVPGSADPYADCRCGHGRSTHASYTGACGLCDCAAVREPADSSSGGVL